jgi:hypothetical protein
MPSPGTPLRSSPTCSTLCPTCMRSTPCWVSAHLQRTAHTPHGCCETSCAAVYGLVQCTVNLQTAHTVSYICLASFQLTLTLAPICRQGRHQLGAHPGHMAAVQQVDGQ